MRNPLSRLGHGCALFVCASYVSTVGVTAGPIQTLIDAAAPGSTVSIPAGVHHERLSIAKNLSLQGTGPQTTVLDGDAQGRVLTISSNVLVTIRDLAVQNGNDQGGGGILNFGNVILNNLVVRNNNGDAGNSGLAGGGIYNAGTMLLTNSLVVSNVAFLGGGIYSKEGSRLTMEGTTLVDNTAVEDGGGLASAGAANLHACNLYGNEALAQEGLGSGLYNVGTMRLQSCRLIENGNYFWGNGGAIWNDGFLRLENSQVISNYALFYSGVASTHTLFVTNSTISGNAAYYDTGGLNNDGDAEVLNSHIDANWGTFGAGIYNGGTLTLRHTSVDRNYHYPNYDGCRGAGLYNQGLLYAYATSICSNDMGDGFSFACEGGGLYNVDEATLENCTVSGNVIRILTSPSYGGGIWNLEGKVTLRSCTVATNTAQRGGGILNGSGTLVMQSTLLANNFAELGTGPDGYGTLISSNFNLIRTTKDCVLLNASATDKLGLDPKLGALALNGGSTLVHALLPGSPAIDSGSLQNASLTDQRGFPRAEDGDDNCTVIPDIGAYERTDPYRPRVTSLQRLSSNSVRIQVQAKPNASCRLQSSASLTSGPWSTVTDMATDSGGFCTFDVATTLPLQFFRAAKICSFKESF